MGDPVARNRRIRAVAKALVLIASLPLAGMCLGAMAGRWWYPAELAGDSSLHAAFLLLPALLVWRRHRLVCGGLLLCLALGVLPWLRAAWEPRAPAPSTAPATTVTVASANLYVYNTTREAAVAAACGQGARIVALAETIPNLDRPAVPIERYPNQLWQPQLNRKWRDGVALLTDCEIVSYAAHDLDAQPFLTALLRVDGRPLHVVVVHTASPISEVRYNERNLQLADIAQTVHELQAATPAPVLLMGDWNLTVSSPAWRDLRRAGGIQRAAQREPGTWPALLGTCGITIDHILGKDLALGPQHAFIVPGGDHRGLVGTIGF